MRTKISITKRFTFEASHVLSDPTLSKKENRERFGKCNRMHGHSYKMYVTVTAPGLKHGMVINFRDLKKIVNDSVISKLDHYHINDVPGFECELPTAENIVKTIWSIVERKLKDIPGSARLKKIQLFETETSSATIEK